MSRRDWLRLYQVVCTCGYHTHARPLSSHAFHQFLSDVDLMEHWNNPRKFKETLIEKMKCPQCKGAYGDTIVEITGWNKYATNKQVEMLKSKGIQNSETLIHASIQYIMTGEKTA